MTEIKNVEQPKDEAVSAIEIAEERRKQYGLTQKLARLVKPATIQELSNGDKAARFRLAIDNEFFTGSAYIRADQPKLEAFYASLEKGQLVSIEYKENVTKDGTFLNIWSMFKREVKKTAKKADK